MWPKGPIFLAVSLRSCLRQHIGTNQCLDLTGQELALGVPYEEAVLHMLHLRRRKLVSLQARQPWVTKRLTVDERGVG